MIVRKFQRAPSVLLEKDFGVVWRITHNEEQVVRELALLVHFLLTQIIFQAVGNLKGCC